MGGVDAGAISKANQYALIIGKLDGEGGGGSKEMASAAII